MAEATGYDLISAIVFNDIATVRALLAGDPTLATFQSYDSRTPLHHACLHDRPQITKLLLSHSTGPLTQSDHTGETPVGLARRCGNLATLRMLAAHGHAGPDCMPAYPLARHLLLAAAHGTPSDVRAAVAVFDAWVNSRNADGRGALHWAVVRGDTEIVEMLIRLGANPDRPDRWGVTPRMEARRTEAMREVFEQVF